MTDANYALLIEAVYHLGIAAVGLTAICLGYGLFRLGLFEKAGELKLAWGEKSLVLKQAAPGTFFAVLGTAIIAVTVVKGVNLSIGGGPAEANSSAATSVSGLFGVTNRLPLGTVIRAALSDYAYCTIAHPTMDGFKGCDDTLRNHDLLEVPEQTDLAEIDRLDAIPAPQRDAKWRSEETVYRNRFLRASQR